MNSDFEKLVEKYKKELMNYHAENPQGGESPKFTADLPKQSDNSLSFNPTAEETEKATELKWANGQDSAPEAEAKYAAEKAENQDTVADGRDMEEPAPEPMPQPEPEIPQKQDIPQRPYIPGQPQSTPEMPVILPGEPMQAPPPAVPNPQITANEGNAGGLEVMPSDDESVRKDGREDDEGYLQVRVVTAEGALPIKDALVVITDPKDNSLISQMSTNIDGLTPVIPLRTVSRLLSETEGYSHPYDTYNAFISKPGYYGVRSVNIPVFGGITNLQTVSLIPLPEFGTPSDEYTIDNPGFAL